MQTPDQPQRNRDEDLTRLAAHVFHGEFCETEGILQERKGYVLPVYFSHWLVAYTATVTPEGSSAICRESGVPDDTWDYLLEILASGMAPERLAPVWYYVCLGDRPAPTHKLQCVTFLSLFQFADGRIYPVQTQIHRDMMTADAFSDGMVASHVRAAAALTAEDIVRHGIDGIHDAPGGANYGGIENFYKLMGLFLRMREQVDPGQWPDILGYARLVQAIIEPPIPEAARRHIVEGMTRKQQAAADPTADAPAPRVERGGWDA